MNALATDFNPAEAGASNAASAWSQTPIGERLLVIRALRHLIATHADELAAATAAVAGRSVAEKLVAEVLPLAEACRWLERNAAQVLAPTRHGTRGRPLWLHGVTSEIHRRPLGTVLVIGPGNYPLFLPAVHSLQALVAGNAVLLKPAPRTRVVALHFARLAAEAGLPEDLLTILPVDVAAAESAIEQGVDKVVFTGSSENGRALLGRLAATNTPAVMELSGEDAVLVFADADLPLVIRALTFGCRLNAGETCIAPRRVIAIDQIAAEFQTLLDRAGLDHFEIERVADEAAAVRLANAGRFALGAAIFSRDLLRAQAAAAEIRTGFVLINDLIVPTADPRLPFGGLRASGFGATRGAEGLLEMTHPHVITTRRGSLRPHFDEPGEDDALLFSAYLRASHGRGFQRIAAARDLLRTIWRKSRNNFP